MGAIAKHCDIESALVRAFMAGEDMMLICAHPDIIRRGYHALLGVARDGKLPKERLKRFTATNRGDEDDREGAASRSTPTSSTSSADETARLNEKLNYKYGGTI